MKFRLQIKRDKNLKTWYTPQIFTKYNWFFEGWKALNKENSGTVMANDNKWQSYLKKEDAIEIIDLYIAQQAIDESTYYEDYIPTHNN